MDIKNFENKSKNFNGKIYFNYSLKKLNWFNIGGSAKIYFKPECRLSSTGRAPDL